MADLLVQPSHLLDSLAVYRTVCYTMIERYKWWNGRLSLLHTMLSSSVSHPVLTFRISVNKELEYFTLVVGCYFISFIWSLQRSVGGGGVIGV